MSEDARETDARGGRFGVFGRARQRVMRAARFVLCRRTSSPQSQSPMPPHYDIESAHRRKGVWPVAGVDEVGRGPLAGPVAAAVILDPARLPAGLDDSKALSAKAREAAFDAILASALGVGVAFVTARDIDASDIRKAALLAMSRAVAALAIAPMHVLVDGRDVPPTLRCGAEAIVKGDATCLSIAAASIVAKVVRDRMMRRLAASFPEYGFEKNAGYGSRQHLAALDRFGPTPVHRMSFAPLRVR